MNRILAGQPRNAEPIDANFQELVAILASLTDANIAVNAGIKGSKLAANSLPGDRIITGSITQTQMGSDSIGSDQYINGSIQRLHHSTVVGQRISKTMLEVSEQTKTQGFSIGGGNTPQTFYVERITGTVGSTPSWGARLHLVYWASGGPTIRTSADVLPTTAIPTATTTLLTVTLSAMSFAAGGGQADITWLYIEN